MNDIDMMKITGIARKAGEEILKIYDRDFSVEQKKDEGFEEGTSPLTEADKASNKVIVEGLKELYPEIPVLSEEGKDIPYEKRKGWKRFWLVDPLDGTKEFIKRNGEFTVNIALVQGDTPVLGVVYVPVKDTLYYGIQGKDGIKKVGRQDPEELKPDQSTDEKGDLTVVASRSHFTPETDKFVKDLREKNKGKEVKLVSAGSSVKLCLVAEGKADIYPRLGPTMEWDTAAAHAVVKSAGRNVYNF
ncbi:3'(2'),5'-bisphosphate nucleotidase CysQ, partial [Candidatus Woesearchaeota archaeon]|nr:3'(2'),5'-bisphosphate nucleotidase CysQ [Candidatus Woesearchaeota archaeon]